MSRNVHGMYMTLVKHGVHVFARVPIQVREVLRRMWARHRDLLSLIFAADAQRSGLALQRSHSADSWRMFFLSALAVPPNKFRPPSRMGDGLCALFLLRAVFVPLCCSILLSL